MVEDYKSDENYDNNLNYHDLKEFYRKNWHSHDAKWQMAVVMKFGWDVGNQLNKEVIKSMGSTIMHRYMKLLNIRKFNSIDDFVDKWCSLIHEIWPADSNYEYEILNGNQVKWLINDCPTYENCKKAGVTKNYECSCSFLREGFFNAAGLSAEQEIKKSLMKGDGYCEINVKFNEK